MSEDAADLSRLADIVVPSPVPWWPPAQGWWILCAGLVAALAILALGAIRHYRRNAYRRAALAELSAVGAVADPAGAAAVSAILKRAALVAYPRAEVAALTGETWLAFLDSSAAMSDFTDGPAAGLARAAYGGPLAQGADILAAARRWVKRHRARA
ncbi:DUF4381 domain-containing protein [Xanthobacter sp. V3C-3]|uniref:DUF4381 domain-containing protein n=1 Tax=Xanthobacter lutulentifluminis TaxID=3119935 RepID=UPI00372683D0